jgi:hypothetical protein
MLFTTSQPDLQQEVLNKLNRALDLVLKTAETASADNNHKVVIQAAREVTRIATLITKMTSPKNKTAPRLQQPTGGNPPAGKKPGEAGIKPEDLILPDLETFFPPHELASMDDVSRELFNNISRNYQEMQAIGSEMAANLGKSAPGDGQGV